MASIRWNISHVIWTQVEKTYPDGLYLFYFYSCRLLRQAKPKTPTRSDDGQAKWQGWPRFRKSMAFIFKAYLLSQLASLQELLVITMCLYEKYFSWPWLRKCHPSLEAWILIISDFKGYICMKYVIKKTKI